MEIFSTICQKKESHRMPEEKLKVKIEPILASDSSHNDLQV